MKKQAKRFGQSSSSVMKKAEMNEKVKKRQVVEEVEPSKKAKKSDVLADVGLNKTLNQNLSFLLAKVILENHQNSE